MGFFFFSPLSMTFVNLYFTNICGKTEVSRILFFAFHPLILLNIWAFFFFFLLSTIHTEKSIVFLQIFDCRFLMDFDFLRCFEHDFAIFGIGWLFMAKYFWEAYNSIINAQNFMKLYIQVAPRNKLVSINFRGNLPKWWRCYSIFFSRILGIVRSRCLMH